ncbi:MAG: hypothetical protein ACE141_05995 [Bryobacteraceae bacterium]
MPRKHATRTKKAGANAKPGSRSTGSGKSMLDTLLRLQKRTGCRVIPWQSSPGDSDKDLEMRVRRILQIEGTELDLRDVLSGKAKPRGPLALCSFPEDLLRAGRRVWHLYQMSPRFAEVMDATKASQSYGEFFEGGFFLQ